MSRSHLVAVSKANPHFRYTLVLTGSFTDWLIFKIHGVDRNTRTVTAFSSGDFRIDVTSLQE